MSQIIKKYLLATLGFSNPDLLEICIKNWPQEKTIELSRFFKMTIDKIICFDGVHWQDVFKNLIENKTLDKYVDYYFGNNEHNGVAKCWNLLLDYAFTKNDYDRLVIVGSDTKFINNFFKEAIIEYEKRNLDVGTRKGFNFFIINKKVYSTVGKFDENFFPAYYEDSDYKQRIDRTQNIKFVGLEVDTNNLEHYGSATLKNNIEYEKANDITNVLNQEYYIKKWGGDKKEEIYDYPFNNPNIGINEWTLDLNFLNEKKRAWNV